LRVSLELAERLGVSPRWIRNRLRDGATEAEIVAETEGLRRGAVRLRDVLRMVGAPIPVTLED
jgi:hypothetical protein